MNTRLVLWGELATDKKALLAIYLDETSVKIHIHAIPKEYVTKDVQDTLFTTWKNGAEYSFPQETFHWEVDANNDTILPEEVKVDRPDVILQSQHIWSKRLMASRINQLLEYELKLLDEKVEATAQYEQGLWDKTKLQWEKITSYQKKNEITWEQTVSLKEKIDALFDALKALKKLSNKQDDALHAQLAEQFQKRIEALQPRLIYSDQWKAIFEDLKTIQAELKTAPLRWNHKRQLFDKANLVFEDLRKYRTTENISKTKGRLSQLTKIADGLKDSIARDHEYLNMQVEKMQHYTKGKLSLDEIKGSFSHIIDRIKEKEEKAAGINQTITQLKKDMAKEKKDSNSSNIPPEQSASE